MNSVNFISKDWKRGDYVYSIEYKHTGIGIIMKPERIVKHEITDVLREKNSFKARDTKTIKEEKLKLLLGTESKSGPNYISSKKSDKEQEDTLYLDDSYGNPRIFFETEEQAKERFNKDVRAFNKKKDAEIVKLEKFIQKAKSVQERWQSQTVTEL